MFGEELGNRTIGILAVSRVAPHFDCEPPKSYFQAEIVAGRVGPLTLPHVFEFD
jgi:hypothetical protein